MDESGNYTLPAALLAQYPALATLNWSELPIEDDGYDAGPSGRSSFAEGDIALQPNIKEEIPELPAAASPPKEPDMCTVLEGNFAANISEKSEPKDSTDDKIEPLLIPEVKEEDQLVLDNKPHFLHPPFHLTMKLTSSQNL